MSVDKVLAFAQTCMTIQMTVSAKQEGHEHDNAHEMISKNSETLR